MSQGELGLRLENPTVQAAGLSDSRKLRGFTLKNRQSDHVSRRLKFSNHIAFASLIKRFSQFSHNVRLKRRATQDFRINGTPGPGPPTST